MIRTVLSCVPQSNECSRRTPYSRKRLKTFLSASALVLGLSAGLGLTAVRPAAADAPTPLLRDPIREPLILRRDLSLADAITPVALTTKTVYYTMIVGQSGAPVSNAVAM